MRLPNKNEFIFTRRNSTADGVDHPTSQSAHHREESQDVLESRRRIIHQGQINLHVIPTLL
jgi:hypothetical protein